MDVLEIIDCLWEFNYNQLSAINHSLKSIKIYRRHICVLLSFFINATEVTSIVNSKKKKEQKLKVSRWLTNSHRSLKKERWKGKKKENRKKEERNVVATCFGSFSSKEKEKKKEEKNVKAKTSELGLFVGYPYLYSLSLRHFNFIDWNILYFHEISTNAWYSAKQSEKGIIVICFSSSVYHS